MSTVLEEQKYQIFKQLKKKICIKIFLFRAGYYVTWDETEWDTITKCQLIFDCSLVVNHIIETEWPSEHNSSVDPSY